MRFYTVSSFDKHLSETLSLQSQELSLLSFVALDPFEKSFLREKALFQIKKKFSDLKTVVLDLSEVTLQELNQEVSSCDLFFSRKLYIFKHLDKASKQILDGITELTTQRGVDFAIFESSEGKVEEKFYEKVKKQLVTLDLSREKPWERKERIFLWLDQLAHKRKKNIHKEVLEFLYEKCQKEFSLMFQEIEKLICFIDPATAVTLKDVQKICLTQTEVNNWNLTEGLVWDAGNILSDAASKEVDGQEFFSLLGQIRYHLQLGMKLKKALVSEGDLQKISSLFPAVNQKSLTKYLQAIPKTSLEFFTTSLTTLFEYELKGKSSNIDHTILWTSLICQLTKNR